MTPVLPEAFNFHKYPVYAEYSSLMPKFNSVSLYDQPFSRCNIVDNRKCTQWPQNDLKHLVSKVPCIHWILTPEVQISLGFALRSVFFQIIEVFCFHNGEILKKLVKNQKLEISNIQKSTFVRTTDKKIQEKGWIDSMVIWGWSNVLKFRLP